MNKAYVYPQPWLKNFNLPVTPVASDGIGIQMSYTEYRELTNMGYNFNVDTSKEIKKGLLLLRL